MAATELPFPALHASFGGAWLLDPATADGSALAREVGKGEAITVAADTPHLLLNAPLVASRLGYPDLSGLDLLELYAFIHPARFMVPTPKGLAHALNLPEPQDESDVPALLHAAAAALLDRCRKPDWAEREGAWSALQSLARMRWPWAGPLAQVVVRPGKAERWLFARLPDWDETPPRPQPKQVTLAGEAVEARLAGLLWDPLESTCRHASLSIL